MGRSSFSSRSRRWATHPEQESEQVERRSNTGRNRRSSNSERFAPDEVEDRDDEKDERDCAPEEDHLPIHTRRRSSVSLQANIPRPSLDQTKKKDSRPLPLPNGIIPNLPRRLIPRRSLHDGHRNAQDKHHGIPEEDAREYQRYRPRREAQDPAGTVRGALGVRCVGRRGCCCCCWPATPEGKGEFGHGDGIVSRKEKGAVWSSVFDEH